MEATPSGATEADSGKVGSTRLALRFSMPDAKLGTNHRRRLHWTEINDLTDKWKHTHLLELQAQLPDGVPHFDYALVEVEQIVPNFRSVVDNDNLTGKSKTVLDAMTLAGMWDDDSPSHVEIALRARQQKGAEPHLLVFVQAWTRPTPLEPLSAGGKREASKSSRQTAGRSTRTSTGERSESGRKGWTIRRRAPSLEGKG